VDVGECLFNTVDYEPQLCGGPNFYEGGFKTWECALDLAKLSVNEDILNESSENPTDLHIIEVRNQPY
jgi:hypothetical protein